VGHRRNGLPGPMTARAKLIVLTATTAFTATFGGVVLPVDAQDPACLYLGFSTWHDADRAAREAQGLLVTALACVRR